MKVSCRVVVLVFLMVLIAGCSRIPLGSMWALRQFSFERFDPGLLRVAMHLPPAYAMPRDALRVDVKLTRREGEAPQHEHFTLHESRDPADSAGLPSNAGLDGRWVVLRLDAAEAERVREFRRRMVALKADSGGGKGSLELGASPQLCRTGAPQLGAPRIATALLWSRDTGWVTLLRDTDLDEMLKSLEAPQALASLPSC